MMREGSPLPCLGPHGDQPEGGGLCSHLFSEADVTSGRQRVQFPRYFDSDCPAQVDWQEARSGDKQGDKQFLRICWAGEGRAGAGCPAGAAGAGEEPACVKEQMRCGLALHRDEMLTQATTGTHLENFMRREMSQSQSHTLHESTYRRRHRQIQDRKVGVSRGKAA